MTPCRPHLALPSLPSPLSAITEGLDKNGENGRNGRSACGVERDDADRAAHHLGARAGDLDVAQRLPVIDEAGRPARQHVARLAERDGEAAVVEVAEVIDA